MTSYPHFADCHSANRGMKWQHYCFAVTEGLLLAVKTFSIVASAFSHMCGFSLA